MSQQRDHWSSSLGFVLAATGSAVGLGNLWKFPYITWENGGGGFVLVYLLCIVAVGMPIMLAEILIGRKTQKSGVAAMREAVGPAWSIVGGWGVFTGFVILSYYIVIAGWSLRYFAKTAGWAFNGFPTGLDLGSDFTAFAGSGGTQMALAAVFMAVTIGVVRSGVSGGIERTARVLLPILFLILLLLLFSALSLGGSGEALSFVFHADFSKLGIEAVLEALGHAFFTLSLGMGAMIVYGSYLSKEASVVKAGALIVILDTVVALVATVVMFSVIFTVPAMREQVGGSPVGMLFISLPELFYTTVPFGAVLAPLFYLLVGFAALTSTISLLEVVTSYIIDQHGVGRTGASLIAGAGIFVLTILASMSLGAADSLSTFEVFEGKQGVLANLDHFASNWQLPIGGFLITLAAGWGMTREATETELLEGGIPGWYSYRVWRFFIRYVAPVAVGAIIVAVFVGVDFS